MKLPLLNNEKTTTHRLSIEPQAPHFDKKKLTATVTCSLKKCMFSGERKEKKATYVLMATNVYMELDFLGN